MLINPRQRLPESPGGHWPLFSAAAAAELDQAVIAGGVSGFELMQRAARSAWQLIQQQWPEARKISVCCGGGNNGGDGLLVALYACQAGLRVRLWLATDPQNYQKEAAQAWQAVMAAGIQPQEGEPGVEDLQQDDLVVDALLGIGLQGEVRSTLASWIETLNACKVAILALDTPSGLLVDTGQVAGKAVKAQMTLTFIVMKPGLFTGVGPEQAGAVWLSDLGVSSEHYPIQTCAYLQGVKADQSCLPARTAVGHKGHHGRLLILGGQAGMGGAVILAGQAALRSGAGMVKLLTAPENVTAALVSQPEMMVTAWCDDPQQLTRQLAESFAWADALLIGPGLGTHEQAQTLWRAVADFSGPVLVDADALNLWAAGWEPPAAQQRPWVVTPHPGEAARLLGCSVQEVEQQRLQSVIALAQKTASVALLKGAGSCCVESEKESLPSICPFGNSGMGVAGMGDLLSGCIAALLAQGLAPGQAARLGMRLHAQAGDQAAADQPRGLLPSDLLPFLREGVN